MNEKTSIEELTLDDISELKDYWNNKSYENHHEINHSEGHGFMSRLLGGEEELMVLFEKPIDLSIAKE